MNLQSQPRGEKSVVASSFQNCVSDLKISKADIGHCTRMLGCSLPHLELRSIVNNGDQSKQSVKSSKNTSKGEGNLGKRRHSFVRLIDP